MSNSSTRVTALGIAVRVLMALGGGYVAYRGAPDVEMLLFPVLTEVRQVPSPDDPHVWTTVDGDIVCWWLHIRKVRDVEVVRRSVAILMPDGSRYFGGPIDSRTGAPFNSRDAKPVGFAGVIRTCVRLPEGFDARPPYSIENFSQYRPRHGFWLLDQPFEPVRVAPAAGGTP